LHDLWKTKFTALEKRGKHWEFFLLLRGLFADTLLLTNKNALQVKILGKNGVTDLQSRDELKLVQSPKYYQNITKIK